MEKRTIEAIAWIRLLKQSGIRSLTIASLLDYIEGRTDILPHD